MARKVDEAANIVFVQLIEHEPGICSKRWPDYGRQGKIDLAWERISHETKESGSWLSSSEIVSRSQYRLVLWWWSASHISGVVQN
jgi:hypothetical protein